MTIVCANRTFRKPNKSGKGYREYKGYYMHRLLYYNLRDYFIPAVKKKWDGVLLFTGIEGSGKTTLAGSIARFCDPHFSLDNVVFTQDQFFEAIDGAPPGKCILFDEAAMAALAQDAASAMQIALIKKFVTIRKKNLFIFLVIPSIFMLRRYFAIFRTRALIHTFTPDGLTRGHFKFYSYDTKRALYVKGIKEFDQSSVKPDFRGNFTDTFGMFFDEKEYDKKKEDAILSISQKEGEKEDSATAMKKRAQNERNMMAYFAYKVMRQNYLRALERGKVKAEFSPKVMSNQIFERAGINIKPGTVTGWVRDGERFIIEQKNLAEQAKQLEEEVAKS